MYFIDIELDTDRIPADRADALLSEHRAWFNKHFQLGHFVMLGPWLDKQNAGMIIANIDSQEQLEQILSEDTYFASKQATYTVRPFKAALVSDNRGAPEKPDPSFHDRISDPRPWLLQR